MSFWSYATRISRLMIFFEYLFVKVCFIVSKNICLFDLMGLRLKCWLSFVIIFTCELVIIGKIWDVLFVSFEVWNIKWFCFFNCWDVVLSMEIVILYVLKLLDCLEIVCKLVLFKFVINSTSIILRVFFRGRVVVWRRFMGLLFMVGCVDLLLMCIVMFDLFNFLLMNVMVCVFFIVMVTALESTM